MLTRSLKLMRRYSLYLLALILSACELKPGDDIFGKNNNQNNVSIWQHKDQNLIKDSISSNQQREKNKLNTAEKLLSLSLNIDVYDEFGNKIGIGSGAFIKPNIVVTNFHVIQDGYRFILTRNSDTRAFQGTILKIDETHDIALLKITNYRTSNFLRLNSKLPRIGTNVLVAGSPEGLSGSISNGIVSSIRKNDPYDFDLIQFTAPISMGSSGGPIINEQFELIGITVGTNSENNAQNLNYAIPSKYISFLLDEENH